VGLRKPGQVKVTGGTIQGEVLEDMTVYKGIPFAAPPVGDFRWKAPQPVVAWDGIRECKEFGPTRCRATVKAAVKTACT
jgi:Carboxylesterase type B